MISFDLFEKRLKLFRYDFVDGLRQVTCSHRENDPTSPSNPAR
jgi:hypothetical protein